MHKKGLNDTIAPAANVRAGRLEEGWYNPLNSKKRVLTINSIVRRYQIETTRTGHLLEDEIDMHDARMVRDFADAVRRGFPEARITWGCSWQALTDQSPRYQEIRETLIRSLSKTGGHLGPNLGVVELTLAMHYVFDTPKDKFVFDVSHQAYIHKLLTGRRDRFETIRQPGGLNGFMLRTESEHDIYGAGHAATEGHLPAVRAHILSGVPLISAGKIKQGYLFIFIFYAYAAIGGHIRCFAGKKPVDGSCVSSRHSIQFL